MVSGGPAIGHDAIRVMTNAERPARQRLDGREAFPHGGPPGFYDCAFGGKTLAGDLLSPHHRAGAAPSIKPHVTRKFQKAAHERHVSCVCGVICYVTLSKSVSERSLLAMWSLCIMAAFAVAILAYVISGVV